MTFCQSRLFLLFGWLLVAGCTSKHRPGADKSTEAELATGWAHYSEGAFDAAATDFARAAVAAGMDLHKKQAALYGSGIVWDMRRPGEDTVRAAQFYDEALRVDPESELAVWCRLAQARQEHLARSSGETLPAVRQAYEHVVAALPGHPAAEEAFLLQQSTLLIDRNPEDAHRALDALSRFVEVSPPPALVASAWNLIARAHDVLGQPAERLAAGLRALETSEADPANPRTDRAGTLWDLAAQAEFDVGDFPTARRLLRRLLDKYPTDDRGYGARLALARMDAVEARLRAGASADEVRRELDPARL